MCAPLLEKAEARMTTLLFAVVAAVLVGVLVVLHRGSTRAWRRRHDPSPRHGWARCPSCRGSGEYHHDLIVPGSRTAPVDACPTCHGVGQLRLDSRAYLNAPYRSVEHPGLKG
jgi:hypothetical protein